MRHIIRKTSSDGTSIESELRCAGDAFRKHMPRDRGVPCGIMQNFKWHHRVKFLALRDRTMKTVNLMMTSANKNTRGADNSVPIWNNGMSYKGKTGTAFTVVLLKHASGFKTHGS